MNGGFDPTRMVDTIRDVLGSGQDVVLKISGDSMRPVFTRGDVVRIKPVSTDRIQPGDIIVIERVADVVTHRAITRAGQNWLTKGDNRLYPDPPASPEMILGRVDEGKHAEKIVYTRSLGQLRRDEVFARLGGVEVYLYHSFLQDGRMQKEARYFLRTFYSLACFPVRLAYWFVYLFWR